MKRLLLLAILFTSSICFAKVFNLHNEYSGVYFKSSYGNSSIQKDLYNGRSGASTTIGGSVDTTISGEFGYFIQNKNLSYRFGLQVLNPQKVSTAGTNVSNTKLMDLTSSIYGIYPMFFLDYFFARTNFSRAIFSIGGGYGRITAKNNYELTTDGTTLYGISSFQEELQSLTGIIETSFGYEIVIAKDFSLTFDTGYKYSKSSNLKYKNAVTNFSGSQTADSDVLKSNGEKLSLDLSHFFAGIQLKIYFNY